MIFKQYFSSHLQGDMFIAASQSAEHPDCPKVPNVIRGKVYDFHATFLFSVAFAKLYFLISTLNPKDTKLCRGNLKIT